MRKIGLTMEIRNCQHCGEPYECEAAIPKKTCSKECNGRLISSKTKGTHKMSEKKRQLNKEIKDAIEAAEEPRKTIFVGGHDGGENFAVTCNEGEIL